MGNRTQRSPMDPVGGLTPPSDGASAVLRGLTLFPVLDDERWGDEAELTVMLDEVGKAIQGHASSRISDGSSATIAFGNDAQVRLLNSQFRGIDKATNVLSFPAGSGSTDDDGQPYLGDVAIAYETVQREAHEQGIEPQHHLVHLVVHGILHLSGHDHMNDADALEMESLETSVLARLGIADPYAD